MNTLQIDEHVYPRASRGYGVICANRQWNPIMGIYEVHDGDLCDI